MRKKVSAPVFIILITLGAVAGAYYFSTRMGILPSPIQTPFFAATNNVSELYKNCGGNSFENTCANNMCIENGVERRVFDLWEQQFKKTHNLSDSYFNEHIIITNVTYEEKSHGQISTNWWQVTYIYQNDWVKSRQSETLNLSSFNNFTNVSGLSDETIINGLNREIENAEKFNSPVIPYSTMTELVNKAGIVFDFCQLDFANVTGELVLGGTSEKGLLGRFLNNCKYGSINLNTGELSIDTGPCLIE